jgi:hypothetical protein
MDYEEIRNNFLEFDYIDKKINLWINERINNIRDNNNFLTILPNLPKFILHIFPLSALEKSTKLNLIELHGTSEFCCLGVGGVAYKFNLGGFATYFAHKDCDAQIYMQIFDNGIVEFVDQSIFDFENQFIYSDTFKKYLKLQLGRIQTILDRLKVEPPYIVTACMVDFAGYGIDMTGKGLSASKDSYRCKITDLKFGQQLYEQPIDIDLFIADTLNKLANACGLSEYR